MKEQRKDFDAEAAQWELNQGRVKLANEVADAIIREVSPSRDMDVLDFGCGTGLVTLRLQPLVRTITGADSSKGMLSVLEGKIRERGITNTRVLHVDFEKSGRVEGVFHLIVSSMTLHHVPDTAGLFSRWGELLAENGRVCFADLETEDGSFHSDNTGVFHFGFDRGRLRGLLQKTGFRDIHDTTATTVLREAEGKRARAYPVFLITARR